MPGWKAPRSKAERDPAVVGYQRNTERVGPGIALLPGDVRVDL
ncbi:hypothetical protein OH799_02105 [Nocardia sp. NBC_00881]|nr:hypothetical protein OH799_02105 [Nocardia sp. NBC_00881]